MTHTMLTKVLINLAIFIIILVGSLIFLKKLNFKNKGYKKLFILYTLFWIPPMLLRPYAGTIQNIFDTNYLWIALAAYGFVGIFVRPFADYLNFSFKSKKAFLFTAIISQFILYIPIIVTPDTTSSILQSIGVGIGASCIGTFQLLFKDEYTKQKSYLSVSILSIPPLLANFLTAPIQSILMSIAKTDKLVDPNILKYLWLIGLIIVIFTFVFIFFIRENKNGLINYYKIYFHPKKDSINLFVLCIIGSLIAFIKFSNSGSIGTLNLQKLGDLYGSNTSSYEGYLSIIFSLFQLLSGVLVGTVLIKRYSATKIFSLGILTWLIYTIGVMFIKNPIGYFSIHSLNGFAYGILYNLILSKVLSKNFKTNKITPMGIYQSILAIGITGSSAFTQLIKNQLNINFYSSTILINCILIIAIVVLWFLFIINEKLIPKFEFKTNTRKVDFII